MNQCQACTGRATTYLCPPCTNQLRDMLRALATGPHVNNRPTSGLLEDLADVVLRRTKLGSSGDSNHRKRGDDQPGLYEPDTENNRRTRQAEAATTLGNIHTTLTTIIEATHPGGITTWRPARTMPHGFIGPLQPRWRRLPADYRPTNTDMATWLAIYIRPIASHQQAGHWHSTITGYTRRITHITDRPARRVWLGPCPTWDDTTRHACGADLYAPEDAIEVYCHTCRATHNCNRLKLLQQNDIERELLTWEKLLRANKYQPDEYRISERTLQHWRKTGRLKPRGWLRPNGRHGGTQHSTADQPLYRWSDVRRLRAERPQRTSTGAAARKR